MSWRSGGLDEGVSGSRPSIRRCASYGSLRNSEFTRRLRVRQDQSDLRSKRLEEWRRSWRGGQAPGSDTDSVDQSLPGRPFCVAISQ
jgi:hypothetical protein